MANFCTFIGRLGADPETRYIETKGGGNAPLVSFSFACDQYPETAPLWVDVAVWDERLQKFCGHLKKGSSVAISGKLSAKPYKSKDGDPRPGLNLKAERIEFVGGKKQEEGQQQPDPGYTDYSADAF